MHGASTLRRSASLAELPPFEPNRGDLLVVIETPKGSRNKYAYDGRLAAFKLKAVLPRGMSFPYDFGFIPGTTGEDGDPLDVLLLLDDPAPMGCVVAARAIGAIEAEQRENGKDWVRNDRLIATATHAHIHGNLKALKELDPKILEEIEAFFGQYNRLKGKDFRAVDRCGPKSARKLIARGIRAHAAAEARR